MTDLAADRQLDHDVIIVGAGFAGLYMLHRLRSAGFSARVLDAADGVGGTWYWNRYPGARCDVQSFDYSYSFSDELQQDWTWSERYATQPEILRYIEHVAERFDLNRDVQLGATVLGATFDDAHSRWTIKLEGGQHLVSTYVVMATGCLSVPKRPSFAGLSDFKGETYISGEWPHHPVQLSGKRVGIIGTGSTGIQLTTAIAREAGELLLFHRTPNFSLPAQNRPLDEEFTRELKSQYDQRRQEARTTTRGYPVPPILSNLSALEVEHEQRLEVYEAVWRNGGPVFTSSFADLLTNPEANATASEFVRGKISSIVQDPATVEALTRFDHPLGTRRPCVDTGYYETFNQPNVALVDVHDDPIVEITADGIRTASGSYDLDVIVFALGFDAMTGALLRMGITGQDGTTLPERWSDGPSAYLGVAMSGFPNLFTVTGPGSPSVLTNMVMAIEQHVDWITGILEFARDQGTDRVEADADTEKLWTQHVVAIADETLFPRANSWWTGANIPGKPRVFMPYIGGLGQFQQVLDDVRTHGYEGFSFS
ncbi:NAD(P)/FAD-dependent oxidoreductase [Aeromicrobium fastidiosum]|uniref:flavin-containing monooxygenase n=1 Tax=Aeromicrobium fastidiosum TaxID=52699 RepID=UPI002023856C|nr:NAD(P)/FAD-dependent oxidoreductase [Aeromicrobium fastidiosum]MCL8250405.1 NAD(P)/FAD-dependent oxidoreductase [Aeromicrobium fastidiosum]